MRKLRRPLAVAVVLAVAMVACFSSLELSSTTQAVVTTNYTSYDFGCDYGPVPLGTQVVGPAGSAFVISPQGPTDDDYVTSIQLLGTCPDFGLITPLPLGSNGTGSAHIYNICTGSGSVGSTGLQAGSPAICNPVTYSFNATFQPSIVPRQSCVVRITSAASITGTPQLTDITLYGSGLGTTYSWDVEPPTIDFGSVHTGTATQTQAVTVSNTGAATFTVTETKLNDTSGVFTVIPPTSTTIGAGSSADWKVSCDPPNPTTYTAQLKFTTSNTQGMLSAMVGLSCTGVTSQVVTRPNPIDMGDHVVGDAGSMQSIELQNLGGASASLTGFAIDSMVGSDLSFVQPPGPIMLAPMEDRPNAFAIQYVPTTESPSGNLGTLTFMDGQSMLSVPIKGTALTASIGAVPASVDFGALCVGATKGQDVAVSTNASAQVKVNSMPPPAAPFSATSMPALPVTLPGGGGSGFTIHASVHPTAAGDFTGHIELDTDIPQMGMRMIPLHATATAGGNAPTPDTVHFGAVGVGQTSPEKVVTLANCGDTPLMVNGTHVDGIDRLDFISPTVDPTPVPAGQQITFHVLMSPRTNGLKSATLAIDDDAGGAVVALDGTAFGGSDDGTSDRRTYYACSSGGSGAWPVGLAVVGIGALRRRRRRRKA